MARRSNTRCAWSPGGKRIVQGRQLHVDTTVVETDTHYPTDRALLGDGVRVLTRTMRRIAQITDHRSPAPSAALA